MSYFIRSSSVKVRRSTLIGSQDNGLQLFGRIISRREDCRTQEIADTANMLKNFGQFGLLN